MALDDESAQDCGEMNEQCTREAYSDGEAILERHQLMQESRTDIDRDFSMGIQDEASTLEDNDGDISMVESSNMVEKSKIVGSSNIVENSNIVESNNIVEDPQEGPSGIDRGTCPLEGVIESSPQNVRAESSQSENTARLERFGNYLERYGPQLERYGNQLEKFGNQLERIGPQLERCGSNLERFGPQLEAIGRQLMPSSSHVKNNSPVEDRARNQPQNNMSLQTQTESGNEGFAPQNSDSCQGSSSPSSSLNRPGQWMNAPNSRRLSRRPSFQVNDGLVRHWIRRRNLESRDLMPFNRFREERRRSIWRNDGDLRDFRRLRSSWRYQDSIFNRPLDNERENIEMDDNAHARLGRLPMNQQPDNAAIQQDNAALPQQDPARAQRNPTVHQDDPDFGFVLVDENSPGPSRPDTSNTTRRPRSQMSLRPLNVFHPPVLGPIAEYNAESDEENEHRQDAFGRRGLRGRDGNIIRSWVMMNNYFQARPLFIGQGDSKAIDGEFTLHRMRHEDPFYNGHDRNLELARIARPLQRNLRAERRQQRQQMAFNALA